MSGHMQLNNFCDAQWKISIFELRYCHTCPRFFKGACVRFDTRFFFGRSPLRGIATRPFARRFPNLYNPNSGLFFQAVVAQLVEQLIRNQ